MKLLELTPDLAICPRHVTAVQRNKLSKKAETCTLFLAGQDLHSGFTIDMTWEEVVDAINQANTQSPDDETDDA